MAHPEDGKDDAKEWELQPKVDDNTETTSMSFPNEAHIQPITCRKRKHRDHETEMVNKKRQIQERLRNVVEKRARKNAGEYPQFLSSFV
jgi:hypothetical protein